METDKDEEESIETESFHLQSLQHPGLCKLPPNVTKMCKWMHKIHLKSPVQVTTQLPLMCYWQFGLRGKRIPTEELLKFYDENGVPYLSDYLQSLPELSTSE